jgi:XTP/dITP diphosphohydrolase
VIFATRNEHKLREIEELLEGVRLQPLPADVELPPEDRETFGENALDKARAAHGATGEESIADDSGIEAVALGGAPGVRSARYAGEKASDEENLSKLLEDVSAAGDDRRVAYVCVLAHVARDGQETLFEGRCEGTLAKRPRGTGGFGYDPAFVPEATGADGRTMAELSPEEKNRISHRGLAARLLSAHLAEGAPAEREGR